MGIQVVNNGMALFSLGGNSGQSGTARCVRFREAFQERVVNEAPNPRQLLESIDTACFYQMLRGPFGSGIIQAGSSIDMRPQSVNGQLFWNVGNAGSMQGAIVDCVRL